MLTLASRAATAELITLKSGERLIARIVQQDEQQVTIEHELFGRAVIPRQQIRSIAPDPPPPAKPVDTLEIPPAGPRKPAQPEPAKQTKPPSAESDSPAASAQDAEQPLISTEEPGTAEPAPTPTDVEEVEAAEAPSDAAAAAEVEAALEPEQMVHRWNPKIFGTYIFPNWDRSFSIGFDLEDGTKNETKLRIGLDLQREDEQQRTRLFARYSFETKSEETSKNEARALIDQIWNMPDTRHFYWAYGQWDWDEFKDWDHRLIYQGGVGHYLVTRDDGDGDFALRLRGGLGMRDTITDGEGDTRIEGVLGVGFDWDITGRQQLSFSNVYNPELRDFSLFRNTTEIAWLLKIEDESNLFLKVALENEYDAQPDGDDAKNDLKILSSLIFKF